MKTNKSSDAPLWIGGGIVLLVLFSFGQVLRHEFLFYDDGYYLTHNEVISRGLTWDGFLWVWTAVVANMWSPLTLLSHMVDVSLFGMRPGLHHFENAVLHAVNAVLLFYLLRRLTWATWRAGIVAAIWAVHPLRAESVAWAAERKDVLSALFWLLTMLAYVRWVERRSAGRYAIVVAMFVLGLLSKPMLVTLPFALVLLDFWPLGRVRMEGEVAGGLRLRSLLLEKWPLFGLSIAAIGMTVWSQGSTGAMGSMEQYPLWARLANAALAYGMYVWTMIVPVNLAVMYPHLGPGVDVERAIAVAAGLAAFSALALFAWKRFPYLLFGWFWFLGTLVPVIGLVQVGSTSRADRYTYLPQIGLLVAIVWTIAALVEHRAALRKLALAVAAIALVTLTGLCYRQVSFWRNPVTLFEHTVIVSPYSANAHFNLGVGYVNVSRPELAAPVFARAHELNPNGLGIMQNWAATLIETGKPDDAIEVMRELMDLDDSKPEYYFQLAMAYYKKGDYPEAMFQAGEALRIDEAYAPAQNLIQQCMAAIPPEVAVE